MFICLVDCLDCFVYITAHARTRHAHTHPYTQSLDQNSNCHPSVTHLPPLVLLANNVTILFILFFSKRRQDKLLRYILLVGVASSLVVVIGGTGATTTVALFVCWLIALSYQFPLWLNYPWDSLLLEMGFLAIFL